jgi:predicted helicase
MIFDEYFKEVKDIYKRGNYTELTFRSVLKDFIEKVNKDILLSEENTKIKGIGRPDYTCFKKKIIKIGYIETKDLGRISSDKGLKKILEHEQIVRYSNEAIPNMIITDYMRFILYTKKEIKFDIKLFSEEDLRKGKVSFNSETKRKLKQLVESFLSYDLPTIKNAKELAVELSKRAKLLRDWSEKQLKEDIQRVKEEKVPSPIYYFYEAFKELIKDAEPIDCVDAYSQTITYGLFLSKIGSHDGVKRESAVSFIPSSIKIIKTIFMNITGDQLPKELSWIVDEIVDILNTTDIKKILSEFVFEGKNYKDPFIHFYENFLEEYDPKKRKHLGVYYTPEPVVSFITKSINEILKKEFGKSTGFADDSVKVLDFATGTGTFLANSFVLALKEIRKAGLTGIERQKIRNHLLKDFYGFEILVSPYVISHLKLGLLLRQDGYELRDDERVQVYLTNTLDPMEKIQGLHAFFRELTFETITANKLKLDTPILVVMGNPPYSVSSSNKSEWIQKLMKDYKKDLNERNIQPLDDDYIKFIRFAQWKIEQNKEGVLGIITNNRYLDGIIHRQIRKELLKSFNKIYILNLHGSSKIVTSTKDENVFDIQQGVTIGIFIKNKEKKKVFYSDLIGTRDNKYISLYENDIRKIEWKELKPKEPYYFFVGKDNKGRQKYSKFISVNQIFLKSTSGVKTHRDSFIVTDTSNELLENLNKLMDSLMDDKLRKKLNCKPDEEKRFREHLVKLSGNFKDKILTYDYRPFDKKKIFYDTILITRHRENVVKNLYNKNICLATTRFISGSLFNHIFCSEHISDICLLSTKTSESAYIFPLYIYEETKDSNQSTLTGGTISNGGKQPNFTEEFKNFIKEKYPNKEITPEEILNYIYAVLHSPTYRKKYEEFLKIDFPKIPFVSDYKKFNKLSDLGNKLIELHLMKKIPPKNIIKFKVSGTDELKFIKYEKNKLFINDKQYFEGIPENVWNFYIGGFQVLNKWLKTRKGNKLTYKEIEMFIKIANIISETIKIMDKIDKIKLD